MKFLKTLLAIAACASINATATTIDFEHPDAMGVPGGTNYDVIPIVTQGFTFSSNADIVDVTTGVNSGEGPAHSGSFVALNDFSGAIAFTATGAGLFSLQDFWIHGFAGDAYDGAVTGYLNGVLVGSVFLSTSADWQNVVANFTRVDRIVIDAGGNFMVDDIGATLLASAVPEPASVALFGLGLAGVAGALRRKRA